MADRRVLEEFKEITQNEAAQKYLTSKLQEVEVLNGSLDEFWRVLETNVLKVILP